MDKDFVEWARTLPKFEKDYMRTCVKAYIAAGATEEEACTYAEMDYLDYKKYPAITLLQLGINNNAIAQLDNADMSEETNKRAYYKALGF